MTGAADLEVEEAVGATDAISPSKSPSKRPDDGIWAASGGAISPSKRPDAAVWPAHARALVRRLEPDDKVDNDASAQDVFYTPAAGDADAISPSKSPSKRQRVPVPMAPPTGTISPSKRQDAAVCPATRGGAISPSKRQLVLPVADRRSQAVQLCSESTVKGPQ